MMDRLNRLYVAYGDDPAAMTRQLLEQIKPEAGLQKDAKIGIKPNLVVAKDWHSGATTNPAIVEAVIEYFQMRGYHDIAIIESAWLAVDTAKAYKTCGYNDLARHYGVELVDVKRDHWEMCEFGGMKIDISARALALDCLINLPLIKGHCQTGMTCALKNMKGLIPDREKRRFHAMGLHKPIAYLNKMIAPALTIADGTCADPGFEEGGKPDNLHTMIAGTDSVLVDAYAAKLLGYQLDSGHYVRIAEKIGVGSGDVEGAEFIYLNNVRHSEKITRSSALESAKALIDADQACSACYGNLLSAMLRLQEGGKPADFRVCVGQGYKGHTGAIGCGSCTAGFQHCIKGCPPSADDIFAYFTQTRRAK
jgi:uncharacterized protein (DUF362 family)